MIDKLCVRRVRNRGLVFDEATIWFGDLHFCADIVINCGCGKLLSLPLTTVWMSPATMKLRCGFLKRLGMLPRRWRENIKS